MYKSGLNLLMFNTTDTEQAGGLWRNKLLQLFEPQIFISFRKVQYIIYDIFNTALWW